MNLGDNIKKLRKLANLTQDDLAEKLNVLTGSQIKRATISNYENSISSPSASDLPSIAKILGVSIDNLFVPPDVPSEFNPQQNIVNEPIPAYGKAKEEVTALKQRIRDLEMQNLAYLKALEAIGAGKLHAGDSLRPRNSKLEG
jgi:transcriptional regulator with XRE-family HTH domain